MNSFVRQYLETALWCSNDHNDNPLDKNYSIEDCSTEMIKQAEEDCAEFLKNADFDGLDMARLAHDFWLTRNRHGAGFWDGDYPEPEATVLTELSHRFGECWLYVGDDDLIYQG